MAATKTPLDFKKTSLLLSYSAAILVYVLTKPAKQKSWYIGFVNKKHKIKNKTVDDEIEEEMDNISFRDCELILKQLFILHFTRKLIETYLFSEYTVDNNHSKMFQIFRIFYFSFFAYWNKKHVNGSLKVKRKQGFIGALLLVIGEMGNYFRYYMLYRLDKVLRESNIDIHKLSPEAKRLLKHNTIHYLFEFCVWIGWLMLNSYSYASVAWLTMTVGTLIPQSITV